MSAVAEKEAKRKERAGTVLLSRGVWGIADLAAHRVRENEISSPLRQTVMLTC